ncbi:Receptor-type guanylate cyclase gcy [Seminavis robusta]|uniref:guanylate cyclase n=1 Tax=Seminavis robusta TaxID=568900 RepID=A0A9N8DGQ1_9STRA|nr:Receptor-type guanylate cyclase gcy [Seminavis robusta]|eukprot:Sro150_g068760.1 Receptor-type guanylate cyclase gcy (913) ;mRNA; r:29066-31992
MCQQLIVGFNECLERLVTERFGLDSWQLVLKTAGLPTTASDDDNDATSMFASHQQHQEEQKLNDSLSSFESTVDLVEAACQVSGHSIDEVLEALGEFIVHYLKEEGYEQWLTCPGGSLKDWMSNLNSLLQHWQSAFTDLAPVKTTTTQPTAPRFYCQEDEQADDGSLILRFYAATSATNDTDTPAAATAALRDTNSVDFGKLAAPIVKGIVSEVAGIQFGVLIDMKPIDETGESNCSSWSVSTVDPKDQWKMFRNNNNTKRRSSSTTRAADRSKRCSVTGMKITSPAQSGHGIGLSSTVTREIFPFHVIVNDKFVIQQVGSQLADVLHATNDKELVGQGIAKFFAVKGHSWSWKQLCLDDNRSFRLEAKITTAKAPSFKATAIQISSPCDASPLVMFLLTPEFIHLQHLRDQGWTLHDIPNHTQRELLLAREHLKLLQERQESMEQLGQSLERERNLLETLLPLHAAEGLRAGKTVEPMLHKDVTFFFSDICGFTDICRELYPWQVIETLNQLYGVMDFLAKKMGIFKIETIGDAYVCCSGLPKKDPQHARNIANFAIAVKHCCRHVLSPVDGAPIQLRIGVNTGPAASGVVGTLNPRFCVFGDTVNTTSRHESSGLPGMVHCSGTTKQELQRQCPGLFQLDERGLVEMKGKGRLKTFWLDGHENNPLVSRAGLKLLDMEVKDLLSKTNFKTKMGLDAHPSFIELQQERRKRRQSFLPQHGSLRSFGSRSFGSANSIGSSMSRCGSALRKIGTLGKVEVDAKGGVSVPLPPTLLRGQSDATARWQNRRRSAANADWDCSSNHSSSFSCDSSQRTKKARTESTESLSLLDLQKNHNNSCMGTATMNASARLLQLVGDTGSGKVGGRSGKKRRRSSNVFFHIAERCKEAAMEDSMSNLGDSTTGTTFPPIPDSI